MITREMIEKGFENGIISIEDEYNGCISLCCRIEDNAFYFAGMEDEDMTAEEYLESYIMEEIVDRLYDILKTADAAGAYGLTVEEWDFYRAVLTSNIY